MKTPEPWRVSMHGGHSGAYCDHAEGSLEAIVEAAIAAGYCVFGVTEHAPRFHQRYLYAEERERGWTVDTLLSMFDAYAQHLDRLVEQYQDRIHILRGFEAEIVPPGEYCSRAIDLMDRLPFDYIVGSVHYVNDIIIDYTPELFARAVQEAGGLEALQVRYYEHVRDMALELRPAVLGHFDLVRKFAGSAYVSDRVQRAAREALEAAALQGCIIDVNTAGYRKGLGTPYPAPELVQDARELGLEFCFGDDSHRPQEVGAGLEEARAYLLALGVKEVSYLRRGKSGLLRERAPL